jgi:hypothetical protein
VDVKRLFVVGQDGWPLKMLSCKRKPAMSKPVEFRLFARSQAGGTRVDENQGSPEPNAKDLNADPQRFLLSRARESLCFALSVYEYLFNGVIASILVVDSCFRSIFVDDHLLARRVPHRQWLSRPYSMSAE